MPKEAVVGILISLVVLTLVVVVHEFGHYVVMRRCGVPVREFSIGFGPALYQRLDKRDTLWSLRIIPLGGYVKTDPEGPDSVDAKSRWARFRMYMAGMFFNSCAAFICLLVSCYVWHRAPGIFVEYAHKLSLPSVLMPLAIAFIGSFVFWLVTPGLVVYQIAQSGLGFFKTAAGPIGIISMGSQAASGAATDPATAAFGMLMYFAILNVGLAGFNLLPLYPLDGGRTLELLIEKIAGASAPKVIKVFRATTGFIIILLIIGIFASDFWKLAVSKFGPHPFSDPTFQTIAIIAVGAIAGLLIRLVQRWRTQSKEQD